jgi:hypothetical protein
LDVAERLASELSPLFWRHTVVRPEARQVLQEFRSVPQLFEVGDFRGLIIRAEHQQLSAKFLARTSARSLAAPAHGMLATGPADRPIDN